MNRRKPVTVATIKLWKSLLVVVFALVGFQNCAQTGFSQEKTQTASPAPADSTDLASTGRGEIPVGASPTPRNGNGALPAGPTATPASTPNGTVSPTPVLTPTPTPRLTPTPNPTSTPTPTMTPVMTPKPTPTPTPVPTATPVPPSCKLDFPSADHSLGVPFVYDRQPTEARITSANATQATINGVSVTVPVGALTVNNNTANSHPYQRVYGVATSSSGARQCDALLNYIIKVKLLPGKDCGLSDTHYVFSLGLERAFPAAINIGYKTGDLASTPQDGVTISPEGIPYGLVGRDYLSSQGVVTFNPGVTHQDILIPCYHPIPGKFQVAVHYFEPKYNGSFWWMVFE